ncbi:hypothetical protein C0J52_05810 [Blattella germanica]|nr:hypothetical protein C0J52_05810 [Blattella germanica]
MSTYRNLYLYYLKPIVLLLLSSFLTTTTTAPIENDVHAMMYLSQFGYLNPQVRNPNSGALISADVMKKAISEFQAFAGLNVTGQMDKDTSETMSLPRCGVSDVVGYASDSRTKRFALQGSRWKVKELTYKIAKYPNELNENLVEEEIQKALDVWAGVTPLMFVRKTQGSVHIEIRFEKGEHGDGDPFDGPGGTLAHAFYPFKGGDAHFDSTESWTIGTSRGIQALYGKKPQSEGNTTKETPKPSIKEDPELCKDASIDAVFNSTEGYTYIFKGFWWFGCKSEESKAKLTHISKRIRGDDLNLDSTDVDDIILDADDARSKPTDEMLAAVTDSARNLVLNEVLVATMIATSSTFWYASRAV